MNDSETDGTPALELATAGGDAILQTQVLSDSASLIPESQDDTIEQPAKVMRLGGMLRQLLAEIRADPLDELSRSRLREIYEASVNELSASVSEDLQDELERLTSPFTDETPPTRDELRVAKAQLVGWLEGLIQGIQATLFAQQVAAQNQLANMRAPLPPGSRDRELPEPPGTYL